MNDPVREYLQQKGCSDHIVSGGFPGLVETWEGVVASVNKGYSFGIDDYLNDMDARQLLEEALQVAPAEEIAQHLHRIQAADAQIRALLVPAEACLWGDEVAATEGWTRAQNWWYFGLPRNAGEELWAELDEE